MTESLEEFNDFNEGENIKKFRQICKQNRSQVFASTPSNQTFNVTVHPFTARLVISLYDALSDSGKNAFNSLTFVSMIDLAVERFQKQKANR